MKARVTKRGVVIPKKLLEGVDEVEIRKEDGVILVVPIAKDDPIWGLGKNPVTGGLPDASENHDQYIISGRAEGKGERMREALRATAGAWKDLVDCEELKRNIYADRLINTRPEPRL
jgi:virulence-associated protein VagC